MRSNGFRVAIIMGAAALLAGGGAASALGEASGQASCIGIEASGISPPGSSDEFPGGMKELVTAVKTEAGKLGPVVRGVAKLHEGSHEKCDEAG